MPQKPSQRAWYLRNRERLRAVNAAYRESHKDEAREYAAKWRAENVEKKRAADRAWSVRNPYGTSAWSKANAHRYRFYAMRRKAMALKATPKWANEFFIDEAYALAVLRTKATGYEWHVDHIVPLISKTVCGLHVEHNLQVIPGVNNIKKSNRYWPDMPVTPSVKGGDLENKNQCRI